MNIYRHPRNKSIIVTNATHCIYVPLPPSLTIPDQINDAHAMLIQRHTRCFLFDPELTHQFSDATHFTLPKTPPNYPFP